MTVRLDAAGQPVVEEDGRPVLRYNFRTVPPPEGVTGIYAVPRSDYIHPLYGLRGESLTLDYPKDHPHHRGVYWAWPEVMFRGKTNDLHALQGVFARPERLLKTEGGARSARIEAVNLWMWEDRLPIVRETVRILARAAEGSLRCVDLRFRYEALEPGVSLARRNTLHYGGLNLRFSARIDQRIVRRIGPPRFPAPECWAELVGVPPGRNAPVGVVILQHPANLEYPEDWVEYPEINWLQPAFPAAGTRFELRPGQPLELAYRLIIREGPALKIPYARLFRDYLRGWRPLSGLADYRFGRPAACLRKWERLIDACPPADHPAAQAALLRLLQAPNASPDLRRWVCARLQVVGDARAVPALIPLLADPKLCGAACQPLEAIPDPAVDAALCKALPKLPPASRLPVIRLLGVRRSARAAPLLVRLAQDKDPAAARAARQALGRIGGMPAATAFRKALERGEADAETAAAALECAERLLNASPSERQAARALLRALTEAQAADVRFRAAAWAQLARFEPEPALRWALARLRSDRPRERRAAATVLRSLPDATFLPALREAFAQLAPPARRVALEELVRRAAPAARDLFRAALADPACAEIAVRGLARVGTAEDVPALARLAIGKGPAASAARETLRRLPGKPADRALILLLREGEGPVRAVAADALAARLRERAAPLLLSLAAAEDPALARTVLQALGDLASPQHACALARLLPRVVPEARGEFWTALVRCAARGVPANALAGAVLEAVRDRKADRAEALASLDALPSPAAEAALREALVGGDSELRKAAVRALTRWPEPLSSDLLRALREADRRFGKDPDLGPLLRRALANAALRGERNLCLGKPVVSSHPWQNGWGPEKAVDGRVALDSYWSCARSPCSLTVDLGKPQTLAAVRVFPYWDGRRYYQYKVEISADGSAWKTAGDMSRNTRPATKEGRLFVFDPTPARYVRVTMLRNSANPGLHIVELQAFGLPPRQTQSTGEK